MQVTTFAPTVSRRVVAQLTLVETCAPASRTLLPEPGILVGARYRGGSSLDGPSRAPLPLVVVTGLRVTSRRMHTFAESGIVVARLRAGAGRAVLGRSADGLSEGGGPLAAWVSAARVAGLEAEIAAATSEPDRVACLERFLVACAAEHPTDALVDAAVGALEASAGTVRVSTLAATLGVSVDTLEKRFRRATGATPKSFAKILKLRRGLVAATRELTLARAAAAAGYCDESHFVREVRAATGTTPARFVAQAHEAC